MIYNQIYVNHSSSFTLGENALEIVDKYKYLGLWCSNNKNIFVKKHSYLAEQARKAIFTIRNYSHSLGYPAKPGYSHCAEPGRSDLNFSTAGRVKQTLTPPSDKTESGIRLYSASALW